MILFSLENMIRGWFVGDFSPSVLKTPLFEVGVLKHHKGEQWPEHYHKVATEITVLISGLMDMNGKIIKPGDGFIFSPNEIAKPIFLEDCVVVVVKTPSVPGDKYIV